MYRSRGTENDLQVLARLNRLGVERKIQEPAQAVTDYLTEVSGFLESYDFMKLGQAIRKEQWNSVMMILRRMDQTLKRLEIVSFGKQIQGLRLAASAREVIQAKQILALLVAKRVQLLNVIRQE